MSQHLTLKWEKFGLSRGLYEMLGTGELVDVTLACQGEFIQAHKTVLAACSPHFRAMFKGNPCQHPIIFMHDVQLPVLHALIDFMYEGEVTVSELDLPGVLKIADALNVSGLASTSKELQDVEEVETPIEPDQEDAGPSPSKISRRKHAAADAIPSHSRDRNEEQWTSSTEGASKTQNPEIVLPVIKVEAEDLLELHDNPIETSMHESDDEDDDEEQSVDTPDVQEEAQDASWFDPGPSTSSSQQHQQQMKKEQQQSSSGQTPSMVSGVSSRGRRLKSVSKKLAASHFLGYPSLKTLQAEGKLINKKKSPTKEGKHTKTQANGKTKPQITNDTAEKITMKKIVSVSKIKYTCKVCGKELANDWSLKRHTNIFHPAYNKKGILCKLCGMAFNRMYSLQVHLRYTHGHGGDDIDTKAVVQKKVTPNKPPTQQVSKMTKNPCKYCSSVYMQHYNLIRHMRKQHPEKLM